MSHQITLSAVPDVPLVQPGDDLVEIILTAMHGSGMVFTPGDVLVLASKIVSKAEGRLVSLFKVIPTAEALRVAEQCQKDPRLVQVILDESEGVSRLRPGLLIMRHRLGFVCANAGVDRSNVSPDAEEETALLLPADPDRTAANLRTQIKAETGVDVGVVIADSHGRPHRMGAVGVAIGVSGLPALEDWRGRVDLFGRPLQHTQVGLADQIASAASLLLGQAAEGTPIVLLRGVSFEQDGGDAADLVRPRDQDLYV